MRIQIWAVPDIPAADGGGFSTNSFADLLQRPISCPGLDSTFVHTVIDIAVASDRDSAMLTLDSQPRQPLVLDTGLRAVTGTPEVYVRTVNSSGVQLSLGPCTAPVAVGQLVAVGQQRYAVAEVSWPGRDPITGMCHGDLDWQRAVLTPIGAPVPTPILDTAIA